MGNMFKTYKSLILKIVVLKVFPQWTVDEKLPEQDEHVWFLKHKFSYSIVLYTPNEFAY